MNTGNTPRLLQHPSHEHDLVLQELSETFSCECHICNFYTEGGPAYHCVDCEFFLHKSCAEMPPEMQHPFHPQHPLALTISSRKDYGCGGCGDFVINKYRYQCDGCRVALHLGCAAATLPPEEEKHKDEQKHQDKDHHEEEMIEHFAHDHPLASFHVDVPNYIRCKACKERISGRVYGCRACIFMLHESCALAPREIMNHPFHPQHPLTLLVDSDPTFRCKVCKRYCFSSYNCNECGFILDMECAVSIVHPPQDDESRSTDNRRDQIHHFSHPHQLTSLHAKAELRAICEFCPQKISSDFYCCPGCPFLLHQSCAELTQEIVHPLHQDHPLIWQEGRPDCSLCSSKHTTWFGFECKECLFGLHVGCAVQSLSATKDEFTLYSKLFHEHPMKLQYFKGYISNCIVCEWPLRGLGYACQEGCRRFVHNTCATPRLESEHPIHPQHQLILHKGKFYRSLPCFACLQVISGGFTFYCDHCEIQCHPRCLRTPTLKHQRHEHSLIYFRGMDKKLHNMPCNVCYNDCRIDFYRCVPCNYNLHFICLPLPPSVKHEFHFHPLVLRDRVVDEHYDYEEQYCDLCETLRNPELGVYYCEECNYAADIDCVIPKVNLEKRRQVEELMLKKLDKDISKEEAEILSLEEKLEKLKEKLETSMKNLVELKKKREWALWQAESNRE
ncbi:uncharacterized protein LOC116207225 [Punica granatum]|uniref:Uncharacterized protein LOC116207225 n=1 Tax=Punica granatum TaxID=22663 RepID=A0A6P8DHF8_PUNGR|nr:uncharacterized protein LOC116207225 [Punica granatum]